ncbi:MAG: efflux RND transporter periplasmic adaptor subunit [Deltaproteobacteria bacterium]|nr:efflux RND transporter periplasmic adaptor subunit [Deltaproteobacteria bacterium]
MKRKVFICVGATFALILTLAVVKYFKVTAAIAEAMSRGQPPESVTSAIATPEEWPVLIAAVGSLSPVSGATLSAEESGRVNKVLFESGELVKAGQVLVELDTSVEDAELQGALAQLELATLNVKRERALRGKQANSQAELDQSEATFRDRAAAAAQLRARVQRKKIVAPFDGRAGIRQVNIGQYISAGTPVVSVQSFDRLYIDYSLPQQAVGEAKSGAVVEVTVDAYPGETFRGTVTAVQPEIDPVTRTLKQQALITNVEEKLRPGMFARVSIILPRLEKIVRVPAAGIQYAPYGDTVYVIEKSKGEDGKEKLVAKPQVVKLGRRRGDQIAVLSGLTGGEEVVSSGTFKLRPGADVFVNNSVMPGADAFPSPPDT